MFFRLQRLSVYFAKLLESKAHPLWGFDDPIDPRAFAREVRERSLPLRGLRDKLALVNPQRSSFSGEPYYKEKVEVDPLGTSLYLDCSISILVVL